MTQLRVRRRLSSMTLEETFDALKNEGHVD